MAPVDKVESLEQLQNFGAVEEEGGGALAADVESKEEVVGVVVDDNVLGRFAWEVDMDTTYRL